MKSPIAVVVLLSVYGMSFSQIRVHVEPADTVKVTKPVVLDSTETAQAAELYGIVQIPERRMRDLQSRLVGDFPDANLDDKVRQQILQALIKEQTALWDFQIERAGKAKDKPLLKALQTAFTGLSDVESPFQHVANQERKKIGTLLEEQ